MHKSKMLAVLALVGLCASGAFAADADITALGATITTMAGEVKVVVVAAITAGFAIFAALWGYRKLKGGLAAS